MNFAPGQKQPFPPALSPLEFIKLILLEIIIFDKNNTFWQKSPTFLTTQYSTLTHSNVSYPTFRATKILPTHPTPHSTQPAPFT